MAKIARRVLEYRERQSRGAVMRPSTFAGIEHEAARAGAEDPRAVAGAAYWKTLAARYRGNPSSVYGMAVHLGYPYLRGEGRVAEDGSTWLSRVTKTADGTGPALFIGWNQLTRKWVIEEERQGNPIQMRIFHDPAIKKFTAAMYDPQFGNLYASGFTKKEAAKNLREVWRRERARRSGNPSGRTYEAAGKSFPSRAKAEKYAKSIEKTSGIRVPVYETTGAENPTYQVVAVRKGGTLGQTINMEFGSLKQAKEYAKTIDRDVFKKPIVTVKNPEGDLGEAEDLYKTFHGRDPREILELTQSAEERGEYTGLGDLVELTIDAPNGDRVVVKFKDDGVRLASSPEGTQLYLLGGNQDISSLLGKFGADSSKDLVDLGELKQIVYEAAKWQTDFTPQEWKHDLGEESGIRPRAFFKKAISTTGTPRIFFAGGTYRVKRPGIVD